jgi:membrane protein YdbS with pleckstrin-like domain
MKWEEIDNTKISIKLLIVVAILVIGYKNNKKEAVSKLVVGAITALAIMNIAIVMTIS